MTGLNFARMRINHLPGFAGQSPLSLSHLRSGPEEWGRIAVELVALAPRPHSLEVGQVLGTVYVESTTNPEHTQVHGCTVTDVAAAPIALRATDYVTVRGYVDPAKDADPDPEGAEIKELLTQLDAMQRVHNENMAKTRAIVDAIAARFYYMRQGQ